MNCIFLLRLFLSYEIFLSALLLPPDRPLGITSISSATTCFIPIRCSGSARQRILSKTGCWLMLLLAAVVAQLWRSIPVFLHVTGWLAAPVCLLRLVAATGVTWP